MIDTLLSILFWAIFLFGLIGGAVIVFILVLWYLENKHGR